MEKTVIDYYMDLPDNLHLAHIPEKSSKDCKFYKMLSDYGSGCVRIMNFYDQFLIVIADFTPNYNFEKISNIKQEYFEISQFETDSSSFKVGGRAVKQVDRGICYYANTQRSVSVFCLAGKPTRFTKIIITKEYFDQFLQARFGGNYEASKNALNFLPENPNSPKLNFIFQQIKDCPAEGTARQLYMEGKVMEILSLVTHILKQKHPHLPVKLDGKDKRSLGKTITLMKNNLSAYPSISELAKVANMSESRFQMAFRQVYGTTAYGYLKVMRMNYALLLLQNSDDNIQNIALKVGYRNAGHFSKLFRETFGMKPQEYRNLHGVK